MTFSFSFVAFDQVVNNAPNMLTMSGGQFNIPITFRGPNGPAHQLGATHSHATECLYANVPGLKVCTPATPRDAKGLLKTAVRDNNPVLVLEAELLYSSKGMIEPAETELLIPLGEAEVKREGSDVTVVCYAQTVPLALAVAEKFEDEDISVEVLDLRSIKPLDEHAIYDSVAKTHRVVIVEQDRPFCGVGAEVCYRIQKNIFDELDAPIARVSQEDVPVPYNEQLEHAVLPNAEKLIAAVARLKWASESHSSERPARAVKKKRQRTKSPRNRTNPKRNALKRRNRRRRKQNKKRLHRRRTKKLPRKNL